MYIFFFIIIGHKDFLHIRRRRRVPLKIQTDRARRKHTAALFNSLNNNLSLSPLLYYRLCVCVLCCAVHIAPSRRAACAHVQRYKTQSTIFIRITNRLRARALTTGPLCKHKSAPPPPPRTTPYKYWIKCVCMHTTYAMMMMMEKIFFFSVVMFPYLWPDRAQYHFQIVGARVHSPLLHHIKSK